jgi:hypothetical protein
MDKAKYFLIVGVVCILIGSAGWVKSEIDYRNQWIEYAHKLEKKNTKTYEMLNNCFDKKPDLFIPELEEYYYNITNDTAAGRYYIQADNIILYTGRSDTTILHEIGHRVWFTKLNESQKEEWTAIHNSNNNTVSNYALKDETEDFAETFEWWYAAKGINDTLRYHFIQNNKGVWE